MLPIGGQHWSSTGEPQMAEAWATACLVHGRVQLDGRVARDGAVLARVRGVPMVRVRTRVEG